MSTSSTPSYRLLGRRLALLWRGCVGALVSLAVMGLAIGYVIQSSFPSEGALGQAIHGAMTYLMVLSGGVIGIFVLWVILAALETRWLHGKQQPQAPGPQGKLFGIRLPRPIATTDPHGAAAARGGYVEAVNATDPFRTLATALAAHEGDVRISLELWGGADGRVQWGIWLPNDHDMVLTTQSLLTGAAPGIEIRHIDDPLHQTGAKGDIHS